MNLRRPAKLNLEVVLWAIFALFAAVFLLQTGEYGGRAAIFPRIITTIVLLLIAIQVFQHLTAKPASRSAAAQEDECDDDESYLSAALKPTAQKPQMLWYISLGWMVLYFILIYLFGFGISTGAYAILIPYLMGYRKLPVLLPFGIILAIALVLLFGNLLSVPLPAGAVFDLLQGG